MQQAEASKHQGEILNRLSSDMKAISEQKTSSSYKDEKMQGEAPPEPVLKIPVWPAAWEAINANSLDDGHSLNVVNPRQVLADIIAINGRFAGLNNLSYVRWAYNPIQGNISIFFRERFDVRVLARALCEFQNDAVAYNSIAPHRRFSMAPRAKPLAQCIWWQLEPRSYDILIRIRGMGIQTQNF